MGQKPNGLEEHEMIIAPHISKLNGYVHTNKVKENQNGKLQRVQS
jgi:hypothetical protein